MLSSLDRRHCSKVGKNFLASLRTFFKLGQRQPLKKKTVNWARTRLTMIVYYNKLVKRALLVIAN